MQLEPSRLADLVSAETGLAFSAKKGMEPDGERWYLIWPSGTAGATSFAIRTTLAWRRLRIQFEPGKFAAELLAEMGNTDESGQSAFRAVLEDCRTHGARIDFRVNGNSIAFDQNDAWSLPWSRFTLSISKGQLELGTDDGDQDEEIVCRWTLRFAAAVLSILPLEEESNSLEFESPSFPEGALKTVQVNRYERDRRNRAAAISIHGLTCKACQINLENVYGYAASGFIEVHHITPVSDIEPGQVIDPAVDLVPLCPNCHAIAHRRVPPFSIDELRAMLERTPTRITRDARREL